MKVNFDNSRQQTFTAIRYRHPVIKETLKDKLTAIDTEHINPNSIDRFDNLMEYYNRYIYKPLSEIGGDLVVKTDKIYCSWKNKSGKRQIFIIAQKAPEVSEFSDNVITYYAVNPNYVPPKHSKYRLKQLYLDRKHNNKLTPIQKQQFLEMDVRYKNPQTLQTRGSVSRELLHAPEFLRPFIIGREILQYVASQGKKAPKQLKAIYAEA